MKLADDTQLLLVNKRLDRLTAVQRIEWSLEKLPGEHIITSSFGIQAAVMLHMTTKINPDIKVVLLDTGYLFPETYDFTDYLVESLNLNLHVYRSHISPAWQERRYGQLWKHGEKALQKYNHINKVEPLQRALSDFNVGSWFTGLRRQQSKSRSLLPVVDIKEGRYKIHPIVDWSNKDIHHYLSKHKLPYNPLWEKGYVSLGDTHSTTPLEQGMAEEDTRFFGLKRECGIHD